MDHLVLFFRDQRLSVEQRLAFCRRFGKLRLRCAPSPISVTVPTDRGEKRPRRKPDERWRPTSAGLIMPTAMPTLVPVATGLPLTRSRSSFGRPTAHYAPPLL
jgi:alpha-ketoglutarate-dependent taurine dioxygenase